MFDVLIAGAGPAGAAAALTIRRMAPKMRMCLSDPGQPAHSIGEGLPPAIAPMLRVLGLWDDFVAQGHLRAHQTQAAWGQAQLQSNDFLFLGKGSGWTLDRVAFNQLLWDAAFAVGDLSLRANLKGLERNGDGWVAKVGHHLIKARCVIDATGRGCTVARLTGARPVLHDKLVAVVRQGKMPHQGALGVTVSARPDGWWYSAPTGPDRRMWTWLTDSDLLRDQPISDPARWSEALNDSPEMRALAEGAVFEPRLVIPAMTQNVQPVTDALPFLSIGDAASCFDPASSQGIAKALRSGIFAGYALYDHLIRGDRNAFGKHRAMMGHEFDTYQAQHALHYGAERRWPAEPFWARRQGAASVA